LVDPDRLKVEEHGGGSKGPPLLFVHGAGGSRLHWPPTVRRLHGVRTLAVDLPGHGDSPPAQTTAIPALAAGLEAWRRRAGLPSWIVSGHSMGGAIALQMALASPSAVAGLILLGTGPVLPVNPLLLDQTGRTDTFEAAVERILAWSFAPEASPRLIELARRRMLETGPVQLHRDLMACDAFDVSARLGEIRVPTLVLIGSGDRMAPRRLSQSLVEGIAGARLEVVEGAGHMLMLEKPEEVGGSLLRFHAAMAAAASAPGIGD
jgi:pimeloyl-ACP methyl ester carboxylesterase